MTGFLASEAIMPAFSAPAEGHGQGLAFMARQTTIQARNQK
jgi:hypothetical protein